MKQYKTKIVNKKINKIKFATRCNECRKIKLVGNRTGECLDCLDWKMYELRK